MERQLGNMASNQSEMPFALVQGEPLTVIPQDLYIPPDALLVFLEAFEGPLDLLLYLIKRQNIDILNIPIAAITKQYMEYIALMETLELELAAEYLRSSRACCCRGPPSLRTRTTRAPSWCADCRNTSSSSRPPRISMRSTGWSAIFT